MEIDINNINNFDDIRKRSHFLSNISFQSVFLVSRVSLKPYYERIMINNDLNLLTDLNYLTVVMAKEEITTVW